MAFVFWRLYSYSLSFLLNSIGMVEQWLLMSRMIMYLSTLCSDGKDICVSSCQCCWLNSSSVICMLVVDIVFWHVLRKMILMKGRCPIWKKPKDVQDWNRPMESVWWTREICFEDADPLTLVFSRWELPMKSGGKKETRILQGFWRIGYDILV